LIAPAPKKEWTPARKKAFIISVLRSGSRRWPQKYETLNEAKTEKKINKATGRLAQHFLCKGCSKEFPAKLVQVDHVKPVVDPAIGFQNWDTFIERLFCDKGNLQVLCKACHDFKTSLEKQKTKKEKQKL
jgi:5-methylcytosine-specific restriction endonuclease McrA